MDIIGLIVAGAIIGALARFVMPGRQNINIVVTIILGVIGVIAGYYLAGAMGVASTSGVDWIRWIISIVVSVLLISIYLAVTGRRSITR